MRYCVHHLNDFSGSPLILRERIGAMVDKGPVMLVTNQGNGFLSSWDGPTVSFSYTKHDNVALRFTSLTIWYFKVAFYLIRVLRKSDTLVLSTLISSPLLLVPLIKRSVRSEVFVNEVLFRVPFWRWIGLKAMHSRQVKKFYLSKFVQGFWGFSGPSQVVYPTLRRSLMELATSNSESMPVDLDELRFLLVCSQIDAKGYRLFIEIAQHFADEGKRHTFALYLSGSAEQFASDYPDHSLPGNLSVIFNETSPDIFFGHDIFLGLTDPSKWVETFGQTFAEAMIAGNITVAPPVGAHLEYIQDGENGFVFDDYSLRGVLKQIGRILSNPDLQALKQRSKDSMHDFLSVQAPYIAD